MKRSTKERSVGVRCRMFYVLLIVLPMLLLRLSISQVLSTSADQEFPPPHWQRTLGAPTGSHYVGRAVCAGCHTAVAETQAETSMGRTSSHAAENEILFHAPTLSYRDGSFLITIERRDNQELYSASDGNHTLSVPLQWAFGIGDAAQTYVFEREGTYYESRASYYSEIHGLDLTMGHDPKPSGNLSAALGRPLSDQEERKCFPCHTSEGVLDGKLHPDRMQPGITCENCHGPGSQHVEFVNKRDWRYLHIFNPGRLGAADLNDFCGTCHRSTRDVLEAKVYGIKNVRFQPYRLEGSRCYDPSDKRITCLACHDPHVQLVTDIRAYDSKCLACHVNSGEHRTASRKAPSCPRARSGCATCHMPRLSLPGAHYKFADHLIRVYREGEMYPD